jgi:hypothetical protein
MVAWPYVLGQKIMVAGHVVEITSSWWEEAENETGRGQGQDTPNNPPPVTYFLQLSPPLSFTSSK